jgi:hypothetical protein
MKALMGDIENGVQTGVSRVAYAKPSAMYIELKPEERLMSCSKTPSDEACDDPSGLGFDAS